jgi:hypothetical protein
LDTRLGSALDGDAFYGIARELQGHGYDLVTDPPIWARGPHHRLVTNPERFILDGAFGPLRAGEIARAKVWGAQLVGASVAHPEGWPIWNKPRDGNDNVWGTGMKGEFLCEVPTAQAHPVTVRRAPMAPHPPEDGSGPVQTRTP